MRLYLRLILIAALLVLEKSLLNLLVDFNAADRALGLGAVVRVTQHWALRCLASFVIATALFGYLRAAAVLNALDRDARALPLRARWAALHVALLVPLMPVSMMLYGRETVLPFALLVFLWVSLAALASIALCAFFGTWPFWRRAILALGPLWGYAALAAAGATLAMGLSQQLWVPAADLTFQIVSHLLTWSIPSLAVDPANRVIDTGRFAVAIDPICSGLEGLGLMLAFSCTLLVLFRREYRFPRALLLVPASLLLAFVLNSMRIAALVLIGDRGHPDVAQYGFHSQAGWIAFNAAAAGVALVSLRSSWLTRPSEARSVLDNPTAAYLLPYLALLLGGMLSRAVSNASEVFYWPSVLVFAAAIVYSWRRLKGVDWRCSWRGLLCGVLAALLWLLASLPAPRTLAAPGVLGPLPLQGLGVHRLGWILLAAVAVPFAQELAFRGYLLRRMATTEFESLKPSAAGLWPWLASSCVSGALQGPQWLPATLVSVLYGWIFMRSGRLGESLAAHALTSVLLCAAAWGLISGGN
jgi:exosortase E/protease (VPEID-CTERM system)